MCWLPCDISEAALRPSLSPPPVAPGLRRPTSSALRVPWSRWGRCRTVHRRCRSRRRQPRHRYRVRVHSATSTPRSRHGPSLAPSCPGRPQCSRQTRSHTGLQCLFECFSCAAPRKRIRDHKRFKPEVSIQPSCSTNKGDLRRGRRTVFW